MTYRPKLFAGIELDEETRAQCAQIAARLEASGLDGRYERPEKLHITLAFLGWVDAEAVESIRGALFSAANQSKPFALTLDKIGVFPHERKPHIIWIGSREQGSAFREIAERVRGAYGELGFYSEKHAVAHVTIARVKDKHAHLPLLDVEPMRLHVRHLTLFESIPDEMTTRYEIRARAPLVTRPASGV